jgi:dTDP-4-dehydrorhamnose reductase
MDKKKTVLVLGANGQLGRCLYDYIENNKIELDVTYYGRQQIDLMYIESVDDVRKFLGDTSYDFAINCAAYTDTWQAEKDYEEQEDIFNTPNWKINSTALKWLSKYFNEKGTHLIHISTDFVYQGNNPKSYWEHEASSTCNMTAYASAKYDGEWYVREIMDNYTIFRTSWLVSNHGNNFLNKVYNQLGNNEITLPYDEYACPTFATCLARFIVDNIVNGNISKCTDKHIFNATNCWEKPVWSKYDFAKYIFGNVGNIKAKKRGNMGNRPQYIEMDMNKTKRYFDVSALEIPIDVCRAEYIRNLGERIRKNSPEREWEYTKDLDYLATLVNAFDVDNRQPCPCTRNMLNSIVYELWDRYGYYPMVTPRIDGWFKDFSGFHFNIWKNGGRHEIETFHMYDSCATPEEALSYAIIDIIDLIKKDNNDE